MTTVLPILFLQDEEAWTDALNTLGNVKGVVIYGHTEKSVARTVEYLSQWDSGDERDDALVKPLPDLNPGEKRVEWGGYVLTWNYGPGYVALDRIVG